MDREFHDELMSLSSVRSKRSEIYLNNLFYFSIDSIYLINLKFEWKI